LIQFDEGVFNFCSVRRIVTGKASPSPEMASGIVMTFSKELTKAPYELRFNGDEKQIARPRNIANESESAEHNLRDLV
jgi:hypothetical protein